MNNPSTVSRIWKDERHIRGTEYSAEVKNSRAYRSYLQNPKQAFRAKRSTCKVYTEAEIVLFCGKRGLSPAVLNSKNYVKPALQAITPTYVKK